MNIPGTFVPKTWCALDEWYLRPIQWGIMGCKYVAVRVTQPDCKAREALESVDTAGAWDDVVPRVDIAVGGERYGTVEEERDAIEQGGLVKLFDPESQKNFTRFAAVVAREVKAKMGTPAHTAANWLVAQDLVQKVLAEKHVRKVDRCVFAPLATQMVFVPTIYDVHGRQFMHSKPVRERQLAFEMRGRTWWQFLTGKQPVWHPSKMERC